MPSPLLVGLGETSGEVFSTQAFVLLPLAGQGLVTLQTSCLAAAVTTKPAVWAKPWGAAKEDGFCLVTQLGIMDHAIAGLYFLFFQYVGGPHSAKQKCQLLSGGVGDFLPPKVLVLSQPLGSKGNTALICLVLAKA